MKTYITEWEIPKQAWDKFINEAFDYESNDQNFKFPFGVMTSKYGRQFIEYCRAAWVAGDMTVDEFCKMNANMPIGFFKSKIDVF